MLGRRQIREKVVEALYAYYQNPIKQDVLENNMFNAIEKIYHLYIYELNFLVALKHLAERQLDINKNKFLASEKDLNPNLKFVNNRVLTLLEDNMERKAFTSKYKGLQWDIHDDLLVRTFQRLVKSKRYQDYMADENDSFELDQKFVGKLFLRYVAENDEFHSMVEDMELSWADDVHIANTMIQKTIGFMKEGESVNTLIRMIKDEEDRSFARNLLKEALNRSEDNETKLGKMLQNWDLERVSLMDRLILVIAMAELDAFRLTPSRVIINEYIEISKAFSTDRSNIFINGILDKYVKETNRI